jgi:uncharacterized membrane protein
MSTPKQEWGDEQVEQIMGNLLRAGVLLSASVVFFAGILYLVRYGGMRPHYRIFRGEPQDLTSVGAIARFAIAEHSRGIIQLGLLLLIATPIARVLFSVYAFARERDWLYVGITFIVLAVLVGSLIWGESWFGK